MGQIVVEKNLDGIEGLCLIIHTVHHDVRGSFLETYNWNDMAEAGLGLGFVQDNQCMSTKGVLRGLHFQKRYPQAKLVHVISGKVFDAAVDLRPGSRTYGKWHGEVLTGEDGKQLLIPRGFAHGYIVLSDTAVFCYKCDEFYHPEDEEGIAWNDSDIGITWPGVMAESGVDWYTVDGVPLILSEKDRKWEPLKGRTCPLMIENDVYTVGNKSVKYDSMLWKNS